MELIYRLGQGGRPVRTVDLVQSLAVAQPTVTKALHRLAREGLIVIHRRSSVELTDVGRQLAEACRERHLLVVRFLVALGVPAAQAELDAEGIEHHVSEATVAAMRRFLQGGR